jgi:hypothetical protein
MSMRIALSLLTLAILVLIEELYGCIREVPVRISAVFNQIFEIFSECQGDYQDITLK